MFIARVALQIQSSHQTAFRSFATSEGKAARALPGCVEYRFCEDVADPTQILLYEEWADRAAFEAYKASKLFTDAGTVLGPMLAAAPRSAYYEADDIFESCAVR